jgi:predicted ATP-binding protein involved in virulence
MRLDKLEIQNYKGIHFMKLNFKGKSAVFFGANGAGKSSVLDCIAVLLSRLIVRIVSDVGTSGQRSFEQQDITIGKKRISCTISVRDGEDKATWTIVKKRKGESVLTSNFSEMRTFAKSIRKTVIKNKLSNLPMIVYYTINRAVLDIPLRIRKTHVFDQLSVYEKSLTSGTDFRIFFEWYRNQEDIENEKKLREKRPYEDLQLKAVRKAIYTLLPGFTDLCITRNPLRMIINKGSERLAINQLSDGEKCLIALVGDLARRMAIANPKLEDPLKGTGIVLIDELELHLHPAWQRNIISLLEKTFPNIQLIITTHSPQILGETKNMNIFLLIPGEKGIKQRTIHSVYGRDSNRILEDIMGTSARDVEIKKKISQLFQAISDESWEEVLKIKRFLEEEIGLDEPDLLRAEVLIRRRRCAKK